MKAVIKRSGLIVKTVMLIVMLSSHLKASADNEWVIMFQNADGELNEIPMTEVGSLVAVDDAYDFSILSVNGNVLAEGVLKVSFGQKGSTAIMPIKSDNNIIGRMVSDKLTLIGVSGMVEVFDAAGICQLKMTATGGETTIGIAQLPIGV